MVAIWKMQLLRRNIEETSERFLMKYRGFHASDWLDRKFRDNVNCEKVKHIVRGYIYAAKYNQPRPFRPYLGCTLRSFFIPSRPRKVSLALPRLERPAGLNRLVDTTNGKRKENWKYIYISSSRRDDAFFEKKDKLPFFLFLYLEVASRIRICIPPSLPRKGSGSLNPSVCLLGRIFISFSEAFSPRRYRRCSVIMVYRSVSRNDKMRNIPSEIFLVVKPPIE